MTTQAVTPEQFDQIYQTTPVQIWIPSLGVSLPFKQLTFEQHNKFLELQTRHASEEFDDVRAGYEFLELLDQIITSSVFQGANLDVLKPNFNIVDRNAIAIQLRVAAADDFTIVSGASSVNVSLKDHVSRITTIGKERFVHNHVITDGNIEVTLDIPSINKDLSITKEIAQYDRESTSFPAFLLFAEVVKFIKQVSITQNGERTAFNLFESDNIPASIAICRRLPLSLMSKVSDYIQEVQKVNEEVVNFVHNDEKVMIPIDTNWFTSV